MGKKMFYFIVGVLGAVMLTTSAIYFIQKKDIVEGVKEMYIVRYSTSDVNLNAIGGLSFSIKANKTDRETAWRIYTQLKTRVASVKFNPSYDSVVLVNKSLYEAFKLIREEVSNIPLNRVRTKKDDAIVDFYMNILNEGIRPYLSKWHLPISSWVESNKEKNSGKSITEIEKTFPKYEDLIKDIESMNGRLEKITVELLKIVKS